MKDYNVNLWNIFIENKKRLDLDNVIEIVNYEEFNYIELYNEKTKNWYTTKRPSKRLVEYHVYQNRIPKPIIYKDRKVLINHLNTAPYDCVFFNWSNNLLRKSRLNNEKTR